MTILISLLSHPRHPGYVGGYDIPQRRVYRVYGRVERVVASISASNVDDASVLSLSCPSYFVCSVNVGLDKKALFTLNLYNYELFVYSFV